METDQLTSLKRLLWEEWDPIGVRTLGGPSDEYDDYAGELLVLIRRGESLAAVERYLDWVTLEWMGLSGTAGNAEIAMKAISILRG